MTKLDGTIVDEIISYRIHPRRNRFPRLDRAIEWGRRYGQTQYEPLIRFLKGEVPVTELGTRARQRYILGRIRQVFAEGTFNVNLDGETQLVSYMECTPSFAKIREVAHLLGIAPVLPLSTREYRALFHFLDHERTELDNGELALLAYIWLESGRFKQIIGGGAPPHFEMTPDVAHLMKSAMSLLLWEGWGATVPEESQYEFLATFGEWLNAMAPFEGFSCHDILISFQSELHWLNTERAAILSKAWVDGDMYLAQHATPLPAGASEERRYLWAEELIRHRGWSRRSLPTAEEITDEASRDVIVRFVAPKRVRVKSLPRHPFDLTRRERFEYVRPSRQEVYDAVMSYLSQQ